MESQENNQDGNSIWISSADKKYILTYADRDYLLSLIEKHCKNISFSENFNKAFRQDFKYMENVLIYLDREYKNYLNLICDEFQEMLSIIVDPTEIKHYSKLFSLRRLKLEWTHYEALLLLQQNTESKSDFSIRDFQENKAEYFYKIREQLIKMDHTLDKIDKQTEKPQTTPDYVTGAIQEGLIDKDWKITKSLVKLARYLIDEFLMEDLDPHVLQQFKNKDGTKIPLNSAQQAVKRAKNNNDKIGTN